MQKFFELSSHYLLLFQNLTHKNKLTSSHQEKLLKLDVPKKVKIVEKYVRYSSCLNKVAGCRPATLLKMNSFAAIFKDVTSLFFLKKCWETIVLMKHY